MYELCLYTWEESGAPGENPTCMRRGQRDHTQMEMIVHTSLKVTNTM